MQQTKQLACLGNPDLDLPGMLAGQGWQVLTSKQIDGLIRQFEEGKNCPDLILIEQSDPEVPPIDPCCGT